MKPISLGRGLVKIFFIACEKRFEVRYRFEGRIYRHKRRSKADALDLGRMKRDLMEKGQTAKMRISDALAGQAERADEQGRLHGLTITQAMEIAIEHKLTERKGLAVPGISVAEVVEQFLSARNAQGLDEYTMHGYRSRLTRFAEAFQIPIGHVRAADLAAWLDTLPVLSCRRKQLRAVIAPRTRNNYLDALHDLEVFAKNQKHLPDDWHEVDRVLRHKTKGRRLIYTPDEMRKLLAGAKDELLPALLFGAFAGLRTEEIEGLQWEDVDWDLRIIHIAARIVKTDESRIVPLLDNLLDWLRPWGSARGPVNRYANLSNQKARLAKQVGLTWRHNALRHSFGTYRVAVTQNVAQVSLEMGNSPRDVKDSYQRPRTADIGKEWFNIHPQSVPNGVLKLIFR
jgi:integrase